MTTESDKTIFVVDDDDFVREALRGLLEAHDYKVEAFASGREFLTHRDDKPDGCLVLDINMPGMSGIDLLRHLRTEQDTTPVILITGRRDSSVERQAQALGAVALLDKPIPCSVFFAALKQALAD